MLRKKVAKKKSPNERLTRKRKNKNKKMKLRRRSPTIFLIFISFQIVYIFFPPVSIVRNWNGNQSTALIMLSWIFINGKSDLQLKWIQLVKVCVCVCAHTNYGPWIWYDYFWLQLLSVFGLRFFAACSFDFSWFKLKKHVRSAHREFTYAVEVRSWLIDN